MIERTIPSHIVKDWGFYLSSLIAHLSKFLMMASVSLEEP